MNNVRKIGVYLPQPLNSSVEIYTQNLLREFDKRGIKTTFLSVEKPDQAMVDILWDPGAGRRGPHPSLLKQDIPIVVSYHGAVHMSLPLAECMPSGIKAFIRGYLNRFKTGFEWARFKNSNMLVITPSSYAKNELLSFFHFDEKRIFSIYHGVNQNVFRPQGNTVSANRFFLHISNYQPVKNFHRIVSAFQRLHKTEPQMQLLAVIPGFAGEIENKNITIIKTRLTQKQIAELYRKASGFIFTSLRETFGFPILESMASGCPVITSSDTGCSEVAGDAAILVNPRSIDDIRNAMITLIHDQTLHGILQTRGLARARQFSWEKSALEHLAVFEQIRRQKNG